MANVLNFFEPTKGNDNCLNLNGSVKKDGKELDLSKINSELSSEVIIAAGALDLTKKVSSLELASTGAITLAAPTEDVIGDIKVIQMTADNGDVTLALTNVQGGTAASTATFDAVNETLILIAGKNKWNVLAEIGVTLS
jgi:hypothetical protein